MASALTAETIFEIMKCMSDVDMRGRVRMGSKSEIFMFFNSIEICRFFDVGHRQ